jgi:hypothetical protein
MATAIPIDVAAARARGWPQRALRWSAMLLVTATWVSGALFGAYILLFFGGTAIRGMAERWNESLPGLQSADALPATAAIGLHFLTGGILLLAGPVQLIGALRRAAPAVHRWIGRLYVVSAGLAGLGGLGFIFGKGTIGGWWMDLGFGIYGLLMVSAAVLTYLHARNRELERHRAWAIRLFALAIGSWLYRMEYGFWFLVAGRVGHSSDFTGWFDMAMVFAFYLPNLAVAELFIRARERRRHAGLAIGAALVLLAATAFVVLATWTFTTRFWGPGMLSGVTGVPL